MNIRVWRKSTAHDVYQAFARCAATEKRLSMADRGDFLLRAYLSEHSPIRAMLFWIEIDGISNRVHTHLVRHHVGVQHWVRTQRPDRGGKEGTRDITMYINAQGLIDMAKVRLCFKAHKDTRAVMLGIRDALRKVDPALASVMVPKCVYRNGLCGEFKPCAPKTRSAIMQEHEYYFKMFERDT